VAADSPDEPRVAREKFGAQKAISSDMYFGRGAYDAAAVEEAQGRLKAFEGRTGIGSDEYFGREEWVSCCFLCFLLCADSSSPRQAEARASYGGGNGGSMLSEGSSLAGLEAGARDVIGRVLSNPDVQNVGDSIRSGALRVSVLRLLFFSPLCGLVGGAQERCATGGYRWRGWDADPRRCGGGRTLEEAYTG
jgi:ADP-ribosylation factor GTPase-activating protein 2/3